jgi:hypothetical protein
MARALVYALIALAFVVVLRVFTQGGGPRGFVLLYQCLGVAGGIPFAIGVGAGVTHHRALTALLLLTVVLALWGTVAAEYARILAACGLGLLAGHAARAAIHEEGTHAGSQREP